MGFSPVTSAVFHIAILVKRGHLRRISGTRRLSLRGLIVSGMYVSLSTSLSNYWLLQGISAFVQIPIGLVISSAAIQFILQNLW
jgi:hypothetical protein